MRVAKIRIIKANDILMMMDDSSKYLKWMIPVINTGISVGKNGKAEFTETDIDFLYENTKLIYKMAKKMKSDFKKARRRLRNGNYLFNH